MLAYTVAESGRFWPDVALCVLELALSLGVLFIFGPWFRSAVKLARGSALLSPKSPSEDCELPHVPPTIPWIGHLLGLQNKGTRYINRLISQSSSPIFTINIPFNKIIVVHPSLDRCLARHVSDTGLAQILAYVGPRIFGLTDGASQSILEGDPRPLHRAKFGDADNVRGLTQRASEFVWQEMDKMTTGGVEVELGRWLFDITVSATASAVWGVENPWRMDREFAENFLTLSESFDDLYRPVAWLTARKAYQARQFLRTRLVAFHAEHRASRVRSVAHSINVVAQSDPNWETNPDYYSIELVSALGLLPTASTLSVWLMRHLLASPDVLGIVVDEVRRLKVLPAGAEAGTRLDVSDVQAACPWLVASWYETLRLHMTGVPRLARHAFALTPPNSAPLSISTGDIFLLPMCASNLDAATWGPDALAFSPTRFIHGDKNRLSTSAARRVKAFGVAGNLCPGRVLGFEVAMAVVAGALRAFDIQSTDGKGFGVPGVKKSLNVGFERYEGDVKVVLTRSAGSGF